MKRTSPRPKVLFIAILLRAALLPGFASSPLLARDVISIGRAEGIPGAHAVAVPVTARHHLPIHGYSLAVSYPRSALSLVHIAQRGTATASGGVDFFNEELNDQAGTGVLGAIFSLSEPYHSIELPANENDAYPQLIAWLLFDVVFNAPGGEQPIRLTDGIGSPPVSNRFTSGGVTVRPELENGSFLVLSDDILSLDSKIAFPGSTVNAIYAYARHSRSLQGFQMGVSFDPTYLTLTNATVAGTAMVPLLGGLSKIEFLLINWTPDKITVVSPTEWRVTTGVIFDYSEPFNPNQVLPPEVSSTLSQSIMRYSFQVKDGADQGGDYLELKLDDSPALHAGNAAFIMNADLSVIPRKVNGRIYFSTGFLQGKAVEFGTGKAISGASVLTDPGAAKTTTKPDGTYSLGDPNGLAPGPYTISVTKNGYYPARVDGIAPGQNATGGLPDAVLFPIPHSNSSFKRGQVNSDDSTDISDSIVLLSYLFQGGEKPGCLEAADTTDDGQLDLSDAINLLQFIFMGGAAPAPPRVTCGPDPTPDILGCELAVGCN